MIIRRAELADAASMTALQNRIIRQGGTTAYEDERGEAQIIASYIAPPEHGICCHVAEIAGQLAGFQTVGLNPALPEGWAEIGTFVSSEIQARGIGQALFTTTRTVARAAGVRVLNATIRADNRPGLAYYARIGFADYSADPGWALKGGEVVGRVSRRLDL
ncbi:GNAT family N-acetyltransferase [Pseudogemmobacter bohemicus]|uniref:GNAT family N-acetyltransferase n=1 Tax=Pseudogemmobacter bohemicus TaxID=2250708 RepID=UPI000DD4E57C|nr:GNAT family N-acetyltransferase [Pseudogemmobacter bohemicus]